MVWAHVPCYSIPSHLIARGREKGLPLFRKVAPLSVVGWRTVVVWGSSLYTFITDSVAVTVCFLIPLLFPVSGAYLNPQSLPFVLPAGGKRGNN